VADLRINALILQNLLLLLQESTKKTQQLSVELALVKAELEKSRKEVELDKKATGESGQIQDAYAKLDKEKKQHALELEQLKSHLVVSSFYRVSVLHISLLSSVLLFIAYSELPIYWLLIAAMLPEISAAGNVLSGKDGLIQLGALHQLTGSSMGIVFRALWPQEEFPEDQVELA
jgi:hypothetical protein